MSKIFRQLLEGALLSMWRIPGFLKKNGTGTNDLPEVYWHSLMILNVVQLQYLKSLVF